ncbi:MAG: GNAT family N-acetyltransferase [Alphaproteobacteria bacterium]|nr:GNAT family N-acetyltransferase [Alphaproteobacteria bacterium]
MRKLTVDDSKLIFEIRSKCFDDFWPKRDFVEMLSNPLYFGFCTDQGFILCRKISDEVEIITFAVLAEHRKQGLGRKLLTSVINQCGKGCTIFLEVAENNIAAKTLYLQLGFIPIAIRKNYYQLSEGTQNAVVMKYKPPFN